MHRNISEFDRVLRGGQVVTPDGVAEIDVGIADGCIAALGRNLAAASQEIDANGLWVMPGGVDPHCHIEQMSGMGVMNADTFETATLSAAMGGTTSVISFAAQAKGQRLSDTLADYALRAQRGARVDHAFHLSISDPEVDGFDHDLAALIAAGHRSIKVFTTYDIRLDDAQILSVMAAARLHGALVCVHAENHGLIDWTRQALLRAGLTAPKYHAPSHPRMAEVEAVSRMISFAEFMACPVMLFHISTAEGVDLIRAARARGVPVWAETCPHYLFMTEDALDQPGLEGAKWMCSPPQRSEADQAALWEGMDHGAIDLVSSDHAPYRFDESGKLSAGPEADFSQIANGLPGLEPRLPLLFDAMMAQGRGGPESFAALTASVPARLYGLKSKGEIAIGKDADLTLWDPQASTVFGANDLHDNVGYNPWEGTSLRGAVHMVLMRGQVIVQDGACLAQPGQGHWLRREQIGTVTQATPAPEVQLLEASE
ncbi:MAG: dihydropyrimidinase [Rhodobacteraceae bacterium]|nr:dihydropyrimidinase [Paracoccaceae bacterium]